MSRRKYTIGVHFIDRLDIHLRRIYEYKNFYLKILKNNSALIEEEKNINIFNFLLDATRILKIAEEKSFEYSNLFSFDENVTLNIKTMGELYFDINEKKGRYLVEYYSTPNVLNEKLEIEKDNFPINYILDMFLSGFYLNTKNEKDQRAFIEFIKESHGYIYNHDILFINYVVKEKLAKKLKENLINYFNIKNIKDYKIEYDYRYMLKNGELYKNYVVIIKTNYKKFLKIF